MTASWIYRLSKTYSPFAVVSVFLALVNGLWGCGTVSVYYYNASLIKQFLSSSGGIVNMLIILLTIPLATVGAAVGFVSLSDKPENRTLSMLGMAVNGLYLANMVI